MNKIILPLLVAVGLIGSASAQTDAKKTFYSPADKFPKNPIGIKLIGHFKVMGDPQIGYYLSADAEAGERDNMRRFNLPQGVRVNVGEKYNITKDAPLIVTSGGILGGYDVKVPAAQNKAKQNETSQNPVVQPEENQNVSQTKTLNASKSDLHNLAFIGGRKAAQLVNPGIERHLAAVAEIRSHLNDGSLLFEIEKGGSPTLTLPNILTQGGIEFLPLISKFGATKNGLNDSNYIAQATFKDKSDPNIYYVYEIDNINDNIGKIPLLKAITVFTFKDPKEYSQIDFLIKNKLGSPLGVWRRSEALSKDEIRNSYVLLDSDGSVLAQSDGDVDILTPMYRSYDKFIEWNKIASEKKPENFAKQFPNNQGVFRWMHIDNDVKKNQVGCLCPIPEYGYQPSRDPFSYAGWTEDQVNIFMRAFYFYPSARSQVAAYIKDQISKGESSKKDIENSFK